MVIKKMPPIEKIHEAYSAIVDGRVNLQDGIAKVLSSDRKKEYTVTWEENVYSSNDNATYWQGYAGYPIIAVLLLTGKLPFNQVVAESFKGINWTELNAKNKANYAKSVAIIMEDLKQKGIDCGVINEDIQVVYEKMKLLDIKCKRSTIRLSSF
ncbi:TPA: hypothetical protein ACGXM6_003618 [Bacillus cereus]